MSRDVAVLIAGEPIEATRARRGSFGALIRQALGPREPDLVELDARADFGPLRAFRAVIVSGSAASVTERTPWMRHTEQRLLEAVRANVPVLGICFGHQLLGSALGGEVAKNPCGREIGTVQVRLLAEDPLIDAGQQPFLANMTHCDSVVSLPPGARVLAQTALEAHAIVRFAERTWGVQFHPEIDAEVMADYVEGRSAAIREEGLNLERIRREVSEAPGGLQVLRRFFALALA